LCGEESPELRKVIIEGSEMLVCDKCEKYGKVVAVPKVPKKTKLKKRKKERDIYEEMGVEELVPNWNEKIRESRAKKGISREELGARIGERTGIISRIENRELRPTDQMVKKLEEELDIKLLTKVKKAPVKKVERKGMTIGDILENEK
jgi:putative transcription factor